MSFARDFNDLLNEYLVACKNMAPIEQLDVVRLKLEHPDIYSQYLVLSPPDTSEGTILFMRAAALNSMLFGLYKMLDNVVDQFFISTANRKYLEKHAGELGLSSVDKLDIDLVTELLDIKSTQIMGGNKYDYPLWAKEVKIALVKSNPTYGLLANTGMLNFNATHCVDEFLEGTAWSANDSETGSFIRIDCQVTVKGYSKLRLYCVGSSDESYDISYSNDNVNWVSAAQLTITQPGWNEVIWPSAGLFKFWKITLVSNSSDVSVVTDMEWYEGPEYVDGAKVYPLAQGEGTFDVVIQSNLSNGIPSNDLLSAVSILINDRRPVCSGFDWGLRVLAPLLNIRDIGVVGTGLNFDRIKTAEDIRAYVNSLLHGQTLYLAQLISIGVQNGADSLIISYPAVDVVPNVNSINGEYEVIRAGVVDVS